MPQVILQLEALSCPSCMQKIESALAHQEGIEKPKVLFHSGKVKANIDPRKISATEVSRLITELGYTVEFVKVREA